MTLTVGTQQTGLYQSIAGYPGDLADGQTIATLGAKSYQCYADAQGNGVIVGNGAFLLPTGQVADNNTDGSTNKVVGIVARNTNEATMDWDDSFYGYSTQVADGKSATIINNGAVYVKGTGLNAAGVADHVPAIGDLVYAKNTDGSIGTAPAGVTPTGYTLISGYSVRQNTNIYSAQPIVANQTLVIIDGRVQ